jgi:hypothetical protein
MQDFTTPGQLPVQQQYRPSVAFHRIQPTSSAKQQKGDPKVA